MSAHNWEVTGTTHNVADGFFVPHVRCSACGLWFRTQPIFLADKGSTYHVTYVWDRVIKKERLVPNCDEFIIQNILNV